MAEGVVVFSLQCVQNVYQHKPTSGFKICIIKKCMLQLYCLSRPKILHSMSGGTFRVKRTTALFSEL
jgi:hypothetical protein